MKRPEVCLGERTGDERCSRKRNHAKVRASGRYAMQTANLKINIPTPLRQYAAGQAAVDVEGKNVGDALSSLTRQFPDLKKHLYTDEGKLRAFVNVYVNDEDIRYLEKENTQLQAGDSISIVPSIAGGAAGDAQPLPCVTLLKVETKGIVPTGN